MVEEALQSLCGHLGPSLEQPCLRDPHGVPLSPRLLEEAMSGQYLSSDFSLPCPPGLDIPEEQRYTITANTLKVSLPAGAQRGHPVLCRSNWRRGNPRRWSSWCCARSAGRQQGSGVVEGFVP